MDPDDFFPGGEMLSEFCKTVFPTLYKPAYLFVEPGQDSEGEGSKPKCQVIEPIHVQNVSG